MAQPTTIIQLSTLDWVSLVSSIASLLLALVSIYLAIHFYIKAKESEQQASNTLTKIDVQTKTLQSITTRMLGKYVDYTTQPKAADETTILLAQIVQGSLTTGLSSESKATVSDESMQELTTAYIAVLYYSAITNSFLQNSIPQDTTESELSTQMPWIRTLLDRSNADFRIALSWVHSADSKYIENSTARDYYNEIIEAALDEQVRDTFDTYVHRSST